MSFMKIVFCAMGIASSLMSTGCEMNEGDEKVSVQFVDNFSGESFTGSFDSTSVTQSKFWETRTKLLNLCRQYGSIGPETDPTAGPVVYWVVDECHQSDRLAIQIIDETGWRAGWAIAVNKFCLANPEFEIYVSGLSQNALKFSSEGIEITGVDFGMDDENLDLVIGKLKKVESNIITSRRSAEQAKLEYLKSVLPTAREHADENSFYYIGTFTSYDGEEPASVCFLQTKHDDELRLEADGCYAGELRAVTLDGEIHPEHDERFWPHTNLEPPYWIVDCPLDGPARKIVGQMVDENFKPVSKVILDKIINLNESDPN